MLAGLLRSNIDSQTILNISIRFRPTDIAQIADLVSSLARRCLDECLIAVSSLVDSIRPFDVAGSLISNGFGVGLL